MTVFVPRYTSNLTVLLSGRTFRKNIHHNGEYCLTTAVLTVNIVAIKRLFIHA